MENGYVNPGTGEVTLVQHTDMWGGLDIQLQGQLCFGFAATYNTGVTTFQGTSDGFRGNADGWLGSYRQDFYDIYNGHNTATVTITYAQDGVLIGEYDDGTALVGTYDGAGSFSLTVPDWAHWGTVYEGTYGQGVVGHWAVGSDEGVFIWRDVEPFANYAKGAFTYDAWFNGGEAQGLTM